MASALDTPLRIETVGKGAFKGRYPLDRWTAQPQLSQLVHKDELQLGTPMYYEIVADNVNVLGGHRVHCWRVICTDGVDLGGIKGRLRTFGSNSFSSGFRIVYKLSTRQRRVRLSWSIRRK